MTTRFLPAVSDREKERGRGRLLELWIEVWPFCHLNCSFCFNAGGNTGFSENLLTPAEYRNIVRQLAALGGRAIGIPGNGEPLHAKNYELTMTIAQQAREAFMRTYVFTAGDLIDTKKAYDMYSAGLGLLVKCNSFKPEVQDALVRSSGYTKRRQEGLELLRRAGFTYPYRDTEGNRTTRLGIVTPVLAENFGELPEMFRWCRENNVLPDIDTVLEAYRGAEYCNSRPALSADAVRSTLEALRQIDGEEYGNNWEVNPTYAGGRCDRYGYHLYVDCWGNISPCLGANKKGVFLGNIRRGRTLADAWDSLLMRRVRGRNYSGKCAECAHFRARGCNSCLGRFADIIDAKCVHTTGCWNFQ